MEIGYLDREMGSLDRESSGIEKYKRAKISGWRNWVLVLCEVKGNIWDWDWSLGEIGFMIWIGEALGNGYGDSIRTYGW